MLHSPFNINNGGSGEFIQGVQGSRSTAAGKRPKLSLASLIGQAILASEFGRARLSAIYEWISERYPDYYKMNCGGWQNSIRHNLTINKAFIRLPKEEGDVPGKGSYWTIHPDYLHQFKDGVFTGKIRGGEYKTISRSRNKRASLSDLPSYAPMDRYPGGYFPVDSELGPNTSSQSLNDPNMMPGSLNMHDEYAIATDEFQGYHQQQQQQQLQQQQQQILPGTAFMMPNIPEAHHRFPSIPAPSQSFNYFGPSGAPMFYNMVPQQIWQPGTHEAHIEGNCECSYCVAPPIPSTNELPHILEDQSTGSLPVLNVAAAQYPPVLPPATVHFQQFYSSAVGGHETEEIAIANMHQQLTDKPAAYGGGDAETAEH